MEYQPYREHARNGEPPWGRTGAAKGRGAGGGIAPTSPPRRVAGSGNSRDRYPARGARRGKAHAASKGETHPQSIYFKNNDYRPLPIMLFLHIEP